MPAAEKNTDTIEQSVIEAGRRLRDGIIILSVDLGKNEALFLPATIFGGLCKVDGQDRIVNFANRYAFHNYSDWRQISDEEGATLAQVWNKVAPPRLQGRSAPWFWIPSLDDGLTPHGRVRKGGEFLWRDGIRGYSYAVPVVRVGPARDLGM